MAQVLGNSAPCQPEREHGRKKRSLQAFQVTNRCQLDPAATACYRRRPDLPGASGPEDVRIDDGSLDQAGVGPVVVQALPHESDWPRVALGHLGPSRSRAMEVEMLDVHVRPQVRAPLRKVAGRL